MRKTTSTEATKKLGQTLAPYLHEGDVVVLSSKASRLAWE